MTEKKSGWLPSKDKLGQVEYLVDGDHSARVDLNGGKITKLLLGGKTILGGFDRIDGGKGETHPCTPNFGPDGRVDIDKKLPQHGPARKLKWEKVENDDMEKLKIRFEIDGEEFPEFSGLVVEQTFSLENGEFVIETTHTNNGEDEIPVNFGEHFYFNALFSGWENLEINEVPVANDVKNTGIIELRDENIISGLDVGEIVLKQEGLTTAVLWTGRTKKGDEFDRSYVCIEPVEGDPASEDDPGFFGSEESMIKPDESRKTVIKLSLRD